MFYFSQRCWPTSGCAQTRAALSRTTTSPTPCSSLFFTDWDDALLYTADGSGDQVDHSHNLIEGGKLTNLYGDDRWLCQGDDSRQSRACLMAS